MDEFPMKEIQISGAALAALLHRASAAAGDMHGYLYGQASISTTTVLSDHSTTAPAKSLLITTITSFLSLPSHLPLPPPSHPSDSGALLLGCLSARRKTPLRPSMKDSSAAIALASNPQLAFTPQNSTLELPPCLFLVITTPFHDQVIHTHEYKAFQYKMGVFEAKTLSIVNIGPSFRSQYDSFSPNVHFPHVDCELRPSNAMIVEDERGETLADQKRNLQDQKQLDSYTEGFKIERLNKMMGSEAAYTAELEELYEKMLSKVEGLTRLVEQSNAKVLEQENKNMKLRRRVAGLE